MSRIYSRTDNNAIREVEHNTTTRAADFSSASMHESTEAQFDRDAAFEMPTPMEMVLDDMNLRAPPPRNGFVQRWIRDGAVDPKDQPHWFKRMRQGWAPRDPSTIPASQRAMFSHVKLADGSSVIRVSGLVLCEIPRAAAMARQEAVKQSIGRQTKAIPPSAEQLRGNEKRGFGGIEVVEDNESTARGRPAATLVE